MIRDAQAQDCPTSPVDYDSEDCWVDADGNPFNGAEWEVCVIIGTSLACRSNPAGVGPIDVTLVSDYSTSSYDYEAWGDINGEYFCCRVDDPGGNGITAFKLQGTDYGDTLVFSTATLTYNLIPTDRNGVGMIDGDAGNDVIHGSDYDGSGTYTYSEILQGWANSDTISGHGGNDLICGGSGADTLSGGTGDDTLCGMDCDDTTACEDFSVGDGGDIMRGGAGNDFMMGEGGEDAMAGGDGDDDMNGGEDGDVMCGDNHTNYDELNDGDTTDESPSYTDALWGNTANTDQLTCGDGSTRWDGVSYDVTGCTGNDELATRPPGCPSP